MNTQRRNVVVGLIVLALLFCCVSALALGGGFGLSRLLGNTSEQVEVTRVVEREVTRVVENDPEPTVPPTEEEDDEPVVTEEGSCKELTTAEVKEMTGVDVQRISTEPAGWVWRAVPKAVADAKCPSGFICTWDHDGFVSVYAGYSRGNIVAGTFRHICEYPSSDAVHNPCQLLESEQENGRRETPSFDVTAGNFSCCP